MVIAPSNSLRASFKIYPARTSNQDEEREIVNAAAECFRVIRDRI